MIWLFVGDAMPFDVNVYVGDDPDPADFSNLPCCTPDQIDSPFRANGVFSCIGTGDYIHIV